MRITHFWLIYFFKGKFPPHFITPNEQYLSQSIQFVVEESPFLFYFNFVMYMYGYLYELHIFNFLGVTYLCKC